AELADRAAIVNLSARGFGERSRDRFRGFHWQVSDRLVHQLLRFVCWQLATNDLELLFDQVREDLRHLLPAPAAEELLLRRVAVAEGDRKAQALQLGQVSENGPGTDVKGLRD